MRFLILLFITALEISNVLAGNSFDLVIVGATPGGIMTAISAARLGKSSVILERSNYIGGLPANGLGATDIETRAATTGLFYEFVNHIREHYVETYGENSEQARLCSNGYHFEPSVGAKVFEEMLSEYKEYITVLTMRQFDADNSNVIMSDNNLKQIMVLNRISGLKEYYKGKIFIDSTYEGDLAAAAGVPYRLGREGQKEFNEPGAGRIYKYWNGPESYGSTFQSDNAIQAYNYRLCLTNNPKNRVLFKKPDNYNREEYVSIIEDVYCGINTDSLMLLVSNTDIKKNIKIVKAGGKSNLPGDKWGIAKVTNMVNLPNLKTDANNQHGVFISTDLPEENWAWPTSSWEWRDKFAERLREYTEGLFYFVQNDESLPKHFRESCREWGLAKDEYIDNGYFPRQVYVREGRRMEGVYFFTAHDALPVKDGIRPPINRYSITASHYALDSHAVRKREKGRAHLDGFLSYPTSVYTVPYGVMVPKDINNLLFPVPVSGSHIGFSTLRMEPCWMAIGQAAGIAASIAIEENIKVQEINIDKLQDILVEQGATLIYYKDVTLSSPYFKMVQYMGVRGFLPEWEARLNDYASKEEVENWSHKAGIDFIDCKEKKRLNILLNIYKELIKKQ